MNTMNKSQILKSLRTLVPSAKLPSEIDFNVKGETLYLKINGKGVVKNMQNDSSAFEGWIVTIKAAIQDIASVVLDWEEPRYENNAQKAHYNRFLMRVAGFKRGYSWFDVAQKRRSEVDDMAKLVDGRTLVVNYPKQECGKVSNPERNTEAVLERELVERWSRDGIIVDEQLPVGLFRNGKVAEANALTPRHASKIDLWMLDNDTIRIYELKARGNESVGIVSELMFYICTVKYMADGSIAYPDITEAKDHRHFKELADAIADKRIKHIIGYFTAPGFHPLIETKNRSILEILNDNRLGIGFDFKYI